LSEKKQKPSELKDVMLQETRRGRRPIDIEEKRRIDSLKRDLRTLLQLGTEDEFREAMLALGLLEDSEAFRETLRVWRDYREP
jgi:hypothetical protein